MTRALFCRLARGAVVVVLGLIVATAGPVGGAAPKKAEDLVKITAKADKPDADGKQTVTVTLNVEAGWHVYANPVGKDAIGLPTVITVSSMPKPEEVKIDYPAGKFIKSKDKDIPDYSIYENKTEIKVHVKRAKGDTKPLEISVKVQTCNDNTCLPGATLKVPVE